MSDLSKYGRFYWCAKVSADLSKDGEIYLMADDVEVDEGALRFICFRKEGEQIIERVNLLVPPGKWNAVFAASVIDGSAVAVEHWAGEIAGPFEEGGGEKDKKRAAPAQPQAKRKGITKSLRYKILERDGFKCRACGKSAEKDGVTLEADHIVAESMWGETTIENLQTLCRDCNRGKGNR